MARHSAILGIVLGAATLGGLATALAHATPPGRNDRIAFVRYRFSDKPLWTEIWSINPDGTGERKVSHSPRGYIDDAPDWAPDGSHIAFHRCAPDDGRCTIWTVRGDGSGEMMLNPPCLRSDHKCLDPSEPVYSPDGRQIAFVDSDGLVVGDTNLKRVRRVFWFGPRQGVPDITSPAWSPDGKRLAFRVRNVNGKRYKPADGTAIFVINLDGTGLRQVTPWKLRAGAGWDGIDWSPDGTRILFRTQPFPGVNDSGGNLFTIRPDGTGLQQLTHYQPFDSSPGALRTGSFSPDGASIVFATYHGANAGGGCCNLPDVFVMSADGTNIRPVTRSQNWDGDPDWGPR